MHPFFLFCKGCTLCGVSLNGFVDACGHYITDHGRHVMICPYCGAYFVQQNKLTKHVLVEHSHETTHIGNVNCPLSLSISLVTFSFIRIFLFLFEFVKKRDAQEMMEMDTNTHIELFL